MRAVTSPFLDKHYPEAALLFACGQASPFVERLARALELHPLLGTRLRHVQGVVTDLDYTLVESKPAFRALNDEVATRLGVMQLEHVAAMDEQMRGQPLAAYLAAFHQVCRAHGRTTCSFHEFLEVRQGVISDLAAGRMTISGGLAQIPDSFLLVSVLVDVWRKPLRVCTHCPRQLATAFVRESGFGSLVADDNMICGDDGALAKDSPEYWQRIVPARDASHWVGLDDTADGAAWMLRAAGLGLVIVRPSSERYVDPLIGLKREFGDRLYILEEFGELFALGRGEG